MTRRRFLLDLLCAGGVIAFMAGLGSQASGQPDPLKKKLDRAIDRAFEPTPTPRPKRRPRILPPEQPPPPKYNPAGGIGPRPPQYPTPGRIVSPPRCN